MWCLCYRNMSELHLRPPKTCRELRFKMNLLSMIFLFQILQWIQKFIEMHQDKSCTILQNIQFKSDTNAEINYFMLQINTINAKRNDIVKQFVLLTYSAIAFWNDQISTIRWQSTPSISQTGSYFLTYE